MRFFSRVVFICNCCFVLAVILRFVEGAHKLNGHATEVITLHPLASLLVTLGYGAIVVNFIFNVFLAVLKVIKFKHKVTKWLIWANFLFLVIQVYYFFF